MLNWYIPSSDNHLSDRTVILISNAVMPVWLTKWMKGDNNATTIVTSFKELFPTLTDPTQFDSKDMTFTESQRKPQEQGECWGNTLRVSAVHKTDSESKVNSLRRWGVGLECFTQPGWLKVHCQPGNIIYPLQPAVPQQSESIPTIQKSQMRHTEGNPLIWSKGYKKCGGGVRNTWLPWFFF